MPVELPDGWRDQLPDEIKESGVLDDIKTIDQMATMVVNGRKLQSKQISIPSEDASPEQRDQFLKDLQTKVPDLVYVGEDADMGNIYDRMGRPKESTGYELPEIPDPLKDNFAKLTSAAHEAGLSKGQMRKISESILNDYSSNVERYESDLSKNQDALKSKYGEAYNEKVESTANFAKQIGFDEDVVGAIKEGTLGVDNMSAFEKVMEGFESPGPRIGKEDGSEFTHLTPDQAEIQLDEILKNKEHAYWDGSSPAHDAAVKKVVELTRAAEAGKKKTESEEFRDALMGRS